MSLLLRISTTYPRYLLSRKFATPLSFTTAHFSTASLETGTSTEKTSSGIGTGTENGGLTSTELPVRKPKEKIVFPQPLNVHAAVDAVKKHARAKFSETVDISVNLGLDPRKPNQSVKGIAKLPHGTGKKVRVGVFATGHDAQAAIEAGADIVGADDLIARIQSGDIPFDTVIATPEMMSMVSKIGKVLGPRGLMPNPKIGTVTRDVAKAVKVARAGAVQFRVEKKGIVHAGIGKVSFSPEQLLDNIRSFMVAVSDVKPEGFKGKYILAVHLSSTMGPGVPVELATVDPSKPRFMVNLEIVKE